MSDYSCTFTKWIISTIVWIVTLELTMKKNIKKPYDDTFSDSDAIVKEKIFSW